MIDSETDPVSEKKGRIPWVAPTLIKLDVELDEDEDLSTPC